MLKSQIEKAHARFVAAQQEEAELAEQEKRLSEMLAQTRDAAERSGGAAEAGAGAGRGSRPVGGDQGRAGAGARRACRPGSATSATQMEAADDQLKRLEATSKQLEQRRTQLAFAEKRIGAFEARARRAARR